MEVRVDRWAPFRMSVSVLGAVCCWMVAMGFYKYCTRSCMYIYIEVHVYNVYIHIICILLHNDLVSNYAYGLWDILQTIFYNYILVDWFV